MNNAKYNFFDWLYKGKTLPVDINADVEAACANFKSERLNKLLRTIREKFLFGDVYYYLSGMNEPLARVNFQYGICLRYVLISEDGMSLSEVKKNLTKWNGRGEKVEPEETILFSRSIYNRSVSKYKPKGEEDENV